MRPDPARQPTLFDSSAGGNGRKVSVSLFHDESNEPFLAHGCLIVPTSSRSTLLRELAHSRAQWSCNTKLHFNELSGKKLTPTDNCASHWVTLGVEALRSRGAKPPFTNPLFCKLGVILFDRRCFVELKKYSGAGKERKLRWSETLLRILLTSVISYCYENDQTVRIEDVFTDGKPHHRQISKYRMLERLKERLGPAIEIAPKASIRHIVSDHRHKECSDQDAAQLLQLTDLLLGSVVGFAGQSRVPGSKKYKVGKAVTDMLKKSERAQT